MSDMADTLPPLPEPRIPRDSTTSTWDKYSAAQMRDYARAAIAAHFPETGCGNIAAVPARTLTDEQIDRIAENCAKAMPDGIRGFLTTWGWRQFARELLDVCAGHQRAAVPAQPVAWMMTPNKKAHRLLMPSVQFEKPVVRADWELTPLYAAPQAVPVPADMALTDDPWRKLYRRAINEANGLTSYVEDRPELRGAERRLAAIEAEARTLATTFEPTPEKKP